MFVTLSDFTQKVSTNHGKSPKYEIRRQSTQWCAQRADVAKGIAALRMQSRLQRSSLVYVSYVCPCEVKGVRSDDTHA